jgi:hypothetical protein
VLFVSHSALCYMLVNIVVVAADRNRLQRKDSRQLGSARKRYISSGTVAVNGCE